MLKVSEICGAVFELRKVAKVSLKSLFIWRNFCIYRIKKFLAEQKLSREIYSEVDVL